MTYAELWRRGCAGSRPGCAASGWPAATGSRSSSTSASRPWSRILRPSAAGGVFVPVNPVLKPAQVAHILADCDVRVLVTTAGAGGRMRRGG